MLRRRDQTVRSLRVEHYSSAVNTHHMQRRGGGSAIERVVQGLAVDGDDAVMGLGKALHEGPTAGGEARRIERAKDPTERIMRRHAVRQA